MTKLIISLSLLVCISCQSGKPLPQIRAELHSYRVALEPVIEQLVMLEQDPELTRVFGRAQVAADAVAIAFDAYLDRGDEAARLDLLDRLDLALAVVDELAPHLNGDERRQARAALMVALVRVVVVQARSGIAQP